MIDNSVVTSANEPSIAQLVVAAKSQSRVRGLTHEFYRYPARFSPVFVRAAIEAYSEPGDWVFDPFVGGGTTLVEAMASGRNALGIDISSLSSFLCEAKTLILTDQEEQSFQRWAWNLETEINIHRPTSRHTDYADAGYYRNIDDAEFWRHRKVIEQALASAKRLRLQGSQTLARCVVLKVGQWALDSRRIKPSVAEFKSELIRQADMMLDQAREFRDKVHALDGQRPKVRWFNRKAAGAESEERIRDICPPRLIVTSPPYPGIHVLYHRWQVAGRRETPAPFWIAGRLDGSGSSYYTMGDRKAVGLSTYFSNLKANFSSISAMAGPETTIVQMVAFSEVEWQLTKYLEVMHACGLKEVQPWGSAIDDQDGRLWRDVPGRRWHAHQKGQSPGSREVVLVHRKRES